MHFRSQPNITSRIVKTEILVATRPRSFTFEFRPTSTRIAGDVMSNIDFQAAAGLEIAFDFDGSSYSFAKADVRIVRRLRTRKYGIEPVAVVII